MKITKYNMQSRRHTHFISVPNKLVKRSKIVCKYCVYVRMPGCSYVDCSYHRLPLIYIAKKDRTI